MTSAEIRQRFLDYFEQKEHQIVKSAPVVLKNDPTLMFTNAGMNQFKDRFLGNSQDGASRVSNSQKCLRVSGKHNDLEEVGVDTYHHTLFEMLGNWSFGDYFKESAIDMAFDFLTKNLGLSSEHMYVSYFEGNNDVPADEETKNLWLRKVDAARIIKGNSKDNFWEMGDTGPCGPCTEIHIDLRPDSERAKGDGALLVNNDHPQVVEIWNLVFIQYNRKKSGELEPLPQKHVDTGMGLERLAMVMQGKTSTYDTDIFQALIKVLEDISGKTYTGSDAKSDVAFRVLADHIRAVCFTIADGQLPSSTGAGYVIRRILRRAIRYAYSFLDLKAPFLHKLAEKLVALMGDHFTELQAQKELLVNVIQEEERAFFKTLSHGLNLLQQSEAVQGDKFSGAKAFELYDTFGFPIDLTQLILSEQGIEVDLERFQEELAQQKNRSRNASKQDVDDWINVSELSELPEFVGYDHLESDCKLIKYRKIEQAKNVFYQVVVNPTPFYPEGGGQVGDNGFFLQEDGIKLEVIDTKKENGLIVHTCTAEPANIKRGIVNQSTRLSTSRNHSATHLLHQALRECLGTHVEQKGSLVHDSALRFDFSHFSSLKAEEIKAVESRVNELILANHPLEEQRNSSMENALEMGALALFGEKYGDRVRVVKFGESVELCGGTHVKQSAEIGLFVLKSEASVASGVRRLEALTAQEAQDYLQMQADALSQIKRLLKNPNSPIEAVENMLQNNKYLENELEKLQYQQAEQQSITVLKSAPTLSSGVRYASFSGMGAKQSKQLANQWKKTQQNLIGLFKSEDSGRAHLSVFISDDIIKNKGLKAGDLVLIGAKHIEGGGGGAPFYASAGGKNPEGLDAAEKAILEKLEA